MFKVVSGELFAPSELIAFLSEIGVQDPVYTMNQIKRKGRGLVGNYRIMYVFN